MTNVVEEFNKLQQEGFVMDCLVKFKELKLLMILYNLTLNEIYFVSTFVNGLKDELT